MRVQIPPPAKFLLKIIFESSVKNIYLMKV